MKVIVFDFDGTIADTLSVIISVGNELLQEIGMEPVSRSNIEHYRGMTIKQGLSELHIPTTKLPYLIARGRKELYKRREELQPVDGVIDSIRSLKDNGATVGMVTSNSRSNVEHFLNKYDAGDLFDFIHTGTSLFGKARMIRSILRKQKLHGGETVYVGDEIRDILAAKKAGISSAVVTWGFNSRSALAQYNPDSIITKPEQLSKLA